jgi:hypothetical protein
MTVDLELASKIKRPAGERCCAPVVYPDVERDHACTFTPTHADAGSDGWC